MFNKVAPQSGCHLVLISVQFLYLQVYTKMYSPLHFLFFAFVIKMMLCSLADSLCYSVTGGPCCLKIETARHAVDIQNLARKEQSRTGFTL